jgi:hypothetical protein
MLLFVFLLFMPQKYKYSTEKQFSFLYMDFTKNKAYRCFEEELLLSVKRKSIRRL